MNPVQSVTGRRIHVEFRQLHRLVKCVVRVCPIKKTFLPVVDWAMKQGKPRRKEVSKINPIFGVLPSSAGKKLREYLPHPIASSNDRRV